jgi:hypothetical protein
LMVVVGLMIGLVIHASLFCYKMRKKAGFRVSI